MGGGLYPFEAGEGGCFMVTAWCLGTEAESAEAGMEISNQNEWANMNCAFIGNGRHFQDCVTINGTPTFLGTHLIPVITHMASTSFTLFLLRKLELERFQNLFDMTERER